MQKRRAAANVFMEQNVVQDEDEAYVAEEPVPYEAALSVQQAAGGAMPPPVSAAPGFFAPSPLPPSEPPSPQRKRQSAPGLKTSEELQLEKEPIKVRETGLWFWRRVVVPPNAYVVHTRIGRPTPVTLGLGLSFRYDPRRDAYMVVPAAMQTIGVVANCISKEKQGINILAYVQWQINDFALAYKKLDFSDSRDPLGIVNAQLREQAEAAIKDKIATMSVEEVLTDKEPIIEELTTRLKAVAEGRKQSGETSEGLGIKIVTVQIKEAFVSSQRLWQDLQAPYRHEQARISRVSYLQMQDQIRQKELETRQLTETREAETMAAIERIKQSKQTEAVQLRLVEESLRFTGEQEAARQRLQLQEETTLVERESQQRLKLQASQAEQELKVIALRRAQEEGLERARLEAEAAARQKALEVEQTLQVLTEETRLAEARLRAAQEQLERETALSQQESAFKLLAQEQQVALERAQQQAGLEQQRQQTMAALELEEATNRVRLALAERELELSRLRQEVRNLVNERDILGQLVQKLPELAAEMPRPQELRVVQLGGDGGPDPLASFLARTLALAESFGVRLSRPDGEGGASSS